MESIRPKSEDELASILKTAYNYACSENYEKAIELCDWLMQDFSTEIAGRRERAAVKTRMGDIDGAIIDLQYVVKADGLEPADFHALGMLLLRHGSTVEAIERFDQAVKVGEAAGHHYYTNSSLLFRAEAKLRICDFDEALKDVSGLPDGYKAYFSGAGMRSKENIADEARAAIERKARTKFQFKK
jgi:tetratricopeptide (TPR) repeat protein